VRAPSTSDEWMEIESSEGTSEMEDPFIVTNPPDNPAPSPTPSEMQSEARLELEVLAVRAFSRMVEMDT